MWTIASDVDYCPPASVSTIMLFVWRTEKERTRALGDLNEQYVKIAKAEGERVANAFYWRWVVAECWEDAKKKLKWVHAGVFAHLLVEYLRHGSSK